MGTKYAFQCPACLKMRMVREKGFGFDPDEMVEIETPKNGTIKIHKNMCSYCESKILRRYYKTTKKDVKDVVKAAAEFKPVAEDESLEDLL